MIRLESCIIYESFSVSNLRHESRYYLSDLENLLSYTIRSFSYDFHAIFFTCLSNPIRLIILHIIILKHRITNDQFK